MGPFRMGDLAGNDIGWAIRKRRYVEKPNLRYSKTADLLCEMGRYGQKTGAGWYDYAAGKRDAIPSKAVEDMIAKHRSELGITPRKISDDEIVHRLVYSLVNEGAKILEEGIASQGQRHRHGLPHRLRLPAAPRRPDVLRRPAGPVQRGAGDEEVCRQSARRRAASGNRRRCWPSWRPKASRSPDNEEASHEPSRHRLHRPHALWPRAGRAPST